MRNEHTSAIPPAVITEVEGLFQQILTKLEPYRTPLTTEERKEMAIVGDKTLAFLEKGKEFVDLYPDLVPAWLDKADFTSDYADLRNLPPLKNLAEQTVEALYNIFYVAGNESYHWVLDFYHSCKQAANRDVPNAKIAAEELGKRFQTRGRKPAKPAE
ncbi:MAG: hypothetical protein LBG90_07285 [Spirochaetaceae bacterium]|jgi:hypothetical protein|nr:hypothetical protein [Spirochaetaceae bacterium]